MATTIGQPGSSRAVVVAGLRTPFVKAQGVFSGLTSLDLGAIVVRELVERSDIDPAVIDQIVFGQAIPTLVAPSIAREVGIASALPKALEAHSVSRACATSLQAFTDVASAMALGVSQVAIAGGTESMSDVPIFTSRQLSRALVKASRAKSLAERVRAFAGVHPRDLVPVPPAIAEYSTGLSMGERAEDGEEDRIARLLQDEIALPSHQRPRPPGTRESSRPAGHARPGAAGYDKTATTDEGIRPPRQHARGAGQAQAGVRQGLRHGHRRQQLAADRRRCGAAGHARGPGQGPGLKPLGSLRAYAYAATDPGEQLLQGPAYAAPIALDRAGMSFGHRPRRDARGLRRAGGLQPAGLRQPRVREEARPR